MVARAPPAGTTRTRFKKVTYKQRLCLHKGSSLIDGAALGHDSVEVDGAPEHENDLGVELHEREEHHLQAALSSTQLASLNGSGQSDKPAYHIPTPDAKGVLAAQEVAELYPTGAYQDPVTYIRFSDTVEDTTKGPSYCLDEEDQEWLDARNKKARDDAAAALAHHAKSPAGKGKGKERAKEDLAAAIARDNPNLRVISEDEFEMVVTVLERVTTEKVPFCHLDVSRIPTLDELLPSFDNDSPLAALALPELPELPWQQRASSSSSAAAVSAVNGAGANDVVPAWTPSNPYRNLAALKHVAEAVYPWWKERREDREGKPIVPFLNFDETNDNDPYVCFRRREVKTMRKTRKTDALHIEKLVRLRSELEHAVSLLSLVAQRERTKRVSLAQQRSCWEAARELLDVKRIWGIAGPMQGLEDDELISGERREESAGGSVNGAAPKKKRKTEEGMATIKIPARKARPSDGEPGSATVSSTAPGALLGAGGLGSAILERVQAVQAYIERECMRKSEADLGWEEGSDAAYQPIPTPAALRAFRPIQSDSVDGSQFSSRPDLALPRSGRPPSFRRRVGRGGRVYLDRRLLAPSPVPSSLSDWPSARAASERSHGSAHSLGSIQPGSRPYQLQSEPTLSGPFAFSPNVRPSLLTSPGRASNVAMGPFAGPLAQSSDASSTSSKSSQRSQSSMSSAGAASGSTQLTEVDDFDMEEDDKSDNEDEDEEYLLKLQERWRYDDEVGRWAGLGLTGLGGMEDDEEAVLDDYDQRFLRFRMSLLEESDLFKLSTDLSNIMQAQAAADAPPPQHVGVVAAGSNSAAHAPSVKTGVQGVPAAMPNQQMPQAPSMSAARAAQTNVGGPLSVLQQQQQMQQQQLQQQQLQLVLQHQTAQQQQQQQQQRAKQTPRMAPKMQQQMQQILGRHQQQPAQPHPLSQAHSFNSSPISMPNGQMPHQQMQPHVGVGMNNGRTGYQQPAHLGYPNPHNPHAPHPHNGTGGSPPMGVHLAPQRPSGSPVPIPPSSKASPGMHAAPVPQQPQPQPQPPPQHRLSIPNGVVPNGLPNMQFNPATQAMQQGQFNGQTGGPQQVASPAAQLMAMKVALSQNPNLQLKLPPNRALQIAQQAAQAAAGGMQNGAPAIGSPMHHATGSPHAQHSGSNQPSPIISAANVGKSGSPAQPHSSPALHHSPSPQPPQHPTAPPNYGYAS